MLTIIPSLDQVRLTSFLIYGDEPYSGIGFWLTFVSLILLLVSGAVVLIGRRKDGNSPAYPMTSLKHGFLAKFNRN